MLITDCIGHAAFMKYKTVECLNPWYDKRTLRVTEIRIAILKKNLSMDERREIVKAKIRMNHKSQFPHVVDHVDSPDALQSK